MRLVLDTNVVVSALPSPRDAQARALDRVLAGDHVLLLDDRIRAEYAEVLARPRFGFGAHDVATLLAWLSAWAEPVDAKPLRLKLPDPDDLPFVEVALAGRADALVTGNPRHYDVPGIPGAVRVVSPAELLGML